MLLELTRSGGFAGLRLERSLDTSQLSNAEAREVERLVSAARVEDLAARSPIRGSGADRFQWDLRVSDEAAETRVIIAEDQVPEQLRALLNEVLRDRQ